MRPVQCFSLVAIFIQNVMWSTSVYAAEPSRNITLATKKVQVLDNNVNYFGASYRTLGEPYYYLDIAAFFTDSESNSSIFKDDIHADSYWTVIAAAKYGIGQFSMSLGISTGLGLGNVREVDGDAIGECRCMLNIYEPFIQLDYSLSKLISIGVQNGRFRIRGMGISSTERSQSVLFQFKW